MGKQVEEVEEEGDGDNKGVGEPCENGWRFEVSSHSVEAV